MDPGLADDLGAALRDLQRQVAAQAAEIAELRAELTAARRSLEPGDVPATGRRRFLALAGGAAAAAALGSRATPAAADGAAGNDQSIHIGVANHHSAGLTASSTLLDYSPAISGRVDYVRVTDNVAPIDSLDPSFGRHLPAAVAGHTRTAADRTLTGITGFSEVAGGNGVLGLATGADGSYGVWGVSTTGNGVVGRSQDGYDFYGEGAGRIGLAAHVFVGPPTGTDTTYSAADIVRDSQGTLWTCVVTGAPGVWREVAGPTSAGAFHAISPSRVFDSRVAEPSTGMVVTGSPRTISVADGRDLVTGAVVLADVVPSGSTAIACNVTVADTTGSGFVLVNPGAVDEIGASTINWQPGQVLANSIIVGIDDARRVTLVAGGGGGAHVIVDVSGYFR